MKLEDARPLTDRDRALAERWFWPVRKYALRICQGRPRYRDDFVSDAIMVMIVCIQTYDKSRCPEFEKFLFWSIRNYLWNSRRGDIRHTRDLARMVSVTIMKKHHRTTEDARREPNALDRMEGRELDPARAVEGRIDTHTYLRNHLVWCYRTFWRIQRRKNGTLAKTWIELGFPAWEYDAKDKSMNKKKVKDSDLAETCERLRVLSDSPQWLRELADVMERESSSAQEVIDAARAAVVLVPDGPQKARLANAIAAHESEIKSSSEQSS
jgi:hypothetical protein